MPDPDDQLAATLAGIRERGYRNGAHGAECGRLSDAAAVDIPRLLAAIGAALKLADGAEEVRDYSGYETHGRRVGWNLRPAALREAITAALAGKEAGDGG